MNDIVTMTAQGQLTIPKRFRAAFGLSGSTKMSIQKKGKLIIVEPKTDFWGLKGSMKSSVSLSDRELKKARGTFQKRWARAM